MRGVLLILLAGGMSQLAGCANSDQVPSCQSDSACGSGEVCARTDTCFAAADVRAVHVTWTLQGMTADATTCQSSPDLEIDFQSDQDLGGFDELGFAPVPCVEGKFSIDKLPTSFRSVELGMSHAGWASGRLDDATGEVALDLPF